MILNLKNIIRKNFNIILIIIISGIVFSSISVYAVMQYTAEQVTFSSENSDWTPENVQNALDDLYNMKVNSTLTLVDSGSSLGTSTATGRNVTKSLDKGQYIIILNEFNTNEVAGTSVSISLDNENNTYTILKSNSNYKSNNYSASSAIGTFYVNIVENGNVIVTGKDVYNQTVCASGLIYQIYKIG